MFVIFIIAFGMPFFLEVAEVIGAVTIGFLTSIFPTIFYIRLVHKGIKKGKERKITFKNGTFLAGITTLGILGTFAALFMAQNRLAFKTNVKNCYVHAQIIKATNDTFDFENKSQSLIYVNEMFDYVSNSESLIYANDTLHFENDSAFSIRLERPHGPDLVQIRRIGKKKKISIDRLKKIV
ncbi:hypothetical protein AVEN_91219-1 [Araneus ventricosus]|uniref:Amino acid transporter transmembrane domain-containing protein n=1 Tax=Araneus ventricosus TaxID=182803 RepID=A0A4Y2KHP7_ARAVE|nr:hypothetical protein AVEN_91219-1 [Araneus ventricosus]